PLDNDGVANLKRQLVAFVSAATGGPIKYTGRSMKEAHRGMGITDAEFNALAGDLQTALKQNGAAAADIAAVLKAVEGTRKDIVEARVTVPPTATLWERLGGEKNVTKVVDDFVALAANNPKVNFLRDGKFPLDKDGVVRLKRQLVAFVSAATGGPIKYTGRSMKEAHRGMGITDAEFNALATDLHTALERNGARPEGIRAALTAVGSTRPD